MRVSGAGPAASARGISARNRLFPPRREIRQKRAREHSAKLIEVGSKPIIPVFIVNQLFQLAAALSANI